MYIVYVYFLFSFNSHFTADEGDLEMAVEYNGSTVAAMDMDSKIGYKQFFSEGSKFQYSGKEWLMHTTMLCFSMCKVPKNILQMDSKSVKAQS